MAGRKSVVRWRDWSEWQRVYTGLFSSEAVDRQRAVSRVAAWRSRGQVAIAVNATAQLVEIALHEEMAQHHHHAIGVSSRSHMELALMYASSIVRCVNGLVDCSQKGAYAMAVSALAQRIGIPLWIVDVRHESTHNQLPSLPVLRLAGQHLLAWLRSNYWERQDAVIRSHVRRIAAVLQPRCVAFWKPVIATREGDDMTVASEAPTDETIDSDDIREIAVPLLVHGHGFNEHVFPRGVLFLPMLTAASDTSMNADALDTATVLATYPREALVLLVLELQTTWGGTSAYLLAALCGKIFDRASQFLVPEPTSDLFQELEMEICLLWIKLLISNEWREHIKFAEAPIEEIYRCGASMLSQCIKASALASASVQETKNSALSTGLLDRLRSTLRACKGVRNHAVVARNAAVERQCNQGLLTAHTVQLEDWSACPLGQCHEFNSSEFDGLVEYPLELDDALPGSDAYAMYESTGTTSEDEDDIVDALMSELDEQYTQSINDTLALKQTVHEHVIHGGQSGVHQTILPQQEVERIQSEIEIW